MIEICDVRRLRCRASFNEYPTWSPPLSVCSRSVSRPPRSSRRRTSEMRMQSVASPCWRQVWAAVCRTVSELRTCFRALADRARQPERVVERAGDVVLVQVGLVAVGEIVLVERGEAERHGEPFRRPNWTSGVRDDDVMLVSAGCPPGLAWMERPLPVAEGGADRHEREGAAAERVAPADVADRPLALIGLRLARIRRPRAAAACVRVSACDRVKETPYGRSAPLDDRGGAGVGHAARIRPLLAQEALEPAERELILEARVERGRDRTWRCG